MTVAPLVDIPASLARVAEQNDPNRMQKLAEDLDRYAAVIAADHPDVVVECGTARGGSACWFASHGLDVVTIDVTPLADAAKSFTDHCVTGIEAREDNIKASLGRSLMLVTALAPKIGYDNAAKIAKTAHHKGTTLREEAVGGGYVTAEEFDAWVRPEAMTAPHD